MSKAHITRATDALTTKVEGPFAIMRTCCLCGHTETRRRGGGRGAGLREGNRQRALMHAHMKAAHPGALATTYDLLEADGWQNPPPTLPLNDLKIIDESS